jgi:DNA-binding CsgD family transcriptional regulator
MEYLIGSPPRIVKGSDIKRNHRGRIVIADSVVALLKASQSKMQELRAQGARTIGEIAEEHGISVQEVRAEMRRIEGREARKASRNPTSPPSS